MREEAAKHRVQFAEESLVAEEEELESVVASTQTIDINSGRDWQKRILQKDGICDDASELDRPLSVSPCSIFVARFSFCYRTTSTIEDLLRPPDVEAHAQKEDTLVLPVPVPAAQPPSALRLRRSRLPSRRSLPISGFTALSLVATKQAKAAVAAAKGSTPTYSSLQQATVHLQVAMQQSGSISLENLQNSAYAASTSFDKDDFSLFLNMRRDQGWYSRATEWDKAGASYRFRQNLYEKRTDRLKKDAALKAFCKQFEAIMVGYARRGKRKIAIVCYCAV
jgi:hypothetical protein